MPELNRANGKPKSGPDVWVRRLKKNDHISVAVCSLAVWEFWVHWAGNRTVPCLKPTKTCPGHRQGLPLKWKGFLYVVNHNARRAEFLEITGGAAKQLEELVGENANLRGKRFTVTRGNGDAARLTFSSLPDWSVFSTATLPEDKDPAKTLCKMWGLEDVTDSPNDKVAVQFGSDV